MSDVKIENPINAKIQLVKMVINNKRTFDVVLSIVKYHAESISSITMSRRTASAIDGKYFPARPPSLPNPFNNKVEINEQAIAIDDSIDSGIVEILYERDYAYSDDEIRRKIKSYTDTKVKS